MTISKTANFIRSDRDHSTSVDGYAVALGIKTDQYFEFNTTGTIIWNMLATPCNIDQIAKFFTQGNTFDVDAKSIEDGIYSFLLALVDVGLVQTINP
jgi:hypothetical protein